MNEKDLERILALAFRWRLHEAEAGKVAVTRAPGCGRIFGNARSGMRLKDKDGKTQAEVGKVPSGGTVKAVVYKQSPGT